MAKIPTKHITELEELHVADHIIIERKWALIPYQHHAIVLSADQDEGTFNMLHYKFVPFTSTTVVNEKVNFADIVKEGLFLVQYGEGECLSDRKVIERANKYIGTKGFHLINHKSKDVALHCKVGSNPRSSKQKGDEPPPYDAFHDDEIQIQTFNESDEPPSYGTVCFEDITLDTNRDDVEPTSDEMDANEKAQLAATSLARIDYDIPRKKIRSIQELKPADHIFVKSIVERHGIVMSVDEETESYEILHYKQKNILISSKKVVIETVKFADVKGRLYCIAYEEEDCLCDEEVLKRANDCIGLKDFHLTKRTSEDIAYYCKIGRPITTLPMNFEEMSNDEIPLNQPRAALTSVDQLSPADHIVFDRGIYGHHGIVIEVFPKANKYRVIHYQSEEGIKISKSDAESSKASENKFENREERPLSKAIIKDEILQFDEKKDAGKVFVVHYQRDECLLPGDVIARAKELVGRREYNLLLRNCECMALYCKTGIEKTEQVRKMFLNLGKHARDIGPRVPGIVIGNLADDIAAFLGRAGVGLGRGLGAGLVAAGGSLEVVLAGIDIYLYEKQRREARIPEKKYHARVVTRPVAAATAIGLGAGGAAIGAPFGPVGMIVGGVVGGLVGAVVPRGTLYAVEKTGYLEEPIYDTTQRKE